MIIMLWTISTIIFDMLGQNARTVYVPSLGGCAIVNGIGSIAMYTVFCACHYSLSVLVSRNYTGKSICP